MMLICVLSMIIFTGCQTTKSVLPPMGKAAVLNLPLGDRPEPINFTPEEMKAIPRPAHAKILNFMADTYGCIDIDEAAVKAHMDYEESLFSDGKGKK